MSLHRQVNRSKYAFDEHPQTVIECAISDGIDALTKIVDTFHVSYNAWIDECVAAFSQLSAQSQKFAGLLNSSFCIR